ncbi:hypothetical protein IAD21_01465 [Abditibacteriota bacterium]|nr:hypothetical protein IAD21_01465 [Abditibacteriota bacterium]
MGKINLEEIYEEILESRELAWEAYAKFQANNEISSWIILNGGTTESRITSGVWTIRGYLYKHYILRPGISWERREDGSNELVSYNLETGERNIIISYDVEDEERVYLFDAEVDLSSRIVVVKHSIAANHLRPENFMLKYDNFDLTKTWRFDQSWEQNRLNVFSDKSG